jgi:hypothetical protein
MPAGFQAFGSAAGYVGAKPFPSVAGLVLDLDPSVGFTPSLWADQSGLGHDVAQAVGANQPSRTAINSGYGRKPTIDFDGSRFMKSAAWGTALSQPFTEFLVGHSPYAAGLPLFAVDGLSGQTTIGLASNPGNVQFYAGTGSVSDANAWTAPAVVCFEFNGASSNIYFAAKTATSANVNPGSAGRTGTTIGSYNAIPLGGYGWKGSIARHLIYTGILAAADRKAIQDYLAATYSLAMGA